MSVQFTGWKEQQAVCHYLAKYSTAVLVYLELLHHLLRLPAAVCASTHWYSSAVFVQVGSACGVTPVCCLE